MGWVAPVCSSHVKTSEALPRAYDLFERLCPNRVELVIMHSKSKHLPQVHDNFFCELDGPPRGRAVVGTILLGERLES